MLISLRNFPFFEEATKNLSDTNVIFEADESNRAQILGISAKPQENEDDNRLTAKRKRLSIAFADRLAAQ